jgi:hypothetical protein
MRARFGSPIKRPIAARSASGSIGVNPSRGTIKPSFDSSAARVGLYGNHVSRCLGPGHAADVRRGLGRQPVLPDADRLPALTQAGSRRDRRTVRQPPTSGCNPPPAAWPRADPRRASLPGSTSRARSSGPTARFTAHSPPHAVTACPPAVIIAGHRAYRRGTTHAATHTPVTGLVPHRTGRSRTYVAGSWCIEDTIRRVSCSAEGSRRSRTTTCRMTSQTPRAM